MRRVWCLVVATVLATGCGSGGPLLPAHGIVTLDGRPLDGAAVTFYPEPGVAVTGGTALTGTDGKFVILGAKGQNGLAPGRYKVTVSKLKVQRGENPSPDDPAAVGAITDADLKQDLPPIWSSPAQTILAFSVTGDGKPIEIPLRSKAKR